MTFWPLLLEIALIGGYVLAGLGLIDMLRHRRSPGSTMAWLIVFIGLPYLGTGAYLFFGRRKSSTLRTQRIRPAPCTNHNTHDTSPIGFARVLTHYGANSPTTQNHVSLCRDGQQGLATLLALIDGAKHRLWLETFIFADDPTGQTVRDHLAARAAAGVDVRVLIDGLGSFKTSTLFFTPLIEAGGHLATFKPVLTLPFHLKTNLRNHRKLVVADGVHSFAGGMNITHADLFSATTANTWQDVSLHIKGPAAADLEATFIRDWQYATGDTLSTTPCETHTPAASPDVSNQVVQLLTTGPDTANDPLYAASLTAIHRATDRIWLTTPYFVPNEALADALTFAAHRGVDVRILIPRRSNHPLTDFAGAALLRDIHKAGARVLRYRPGMMHAKTMLIDHTFAAVGSANFDYRSLFLNYELMQFCYDPLTLDSLADWFTQLSQQCDDDLPNPSLIRQLAEGVVRAIAPMF
ncbi:MAG: cardiolipin synthase [Algisphaera sp.]